jgi:hypothetical protein
MDHELPQEVLDLTRQLREDNDVFWSRLRELLRDKGIDVETSWLAELYPDDGEDYGMIVTADCHTYQFAYNDRHEPLHESILAEWNDRTARAVHLGASPEVKQIMRFLGSD